MIKVLLKVLGFTFLNIFALKVFIWAMNSGRILESSRVFNFWRSFSSSVGLTIV